MTSLHVYFALRNQQAFQRLLDASRASYAQTNSGPALSSSGGRSWNKPSPLSGGNALSSACDVNARDWLGRTVLHLAVSSVDPAALEFVKLLLTHPRIDVNIMDTESRWTPLHRAAYDGNLPACVLLLQRGDIDVSLKDFEGYTAFDVYNSTVEGTKPNELEATDLFTWGTNKNAALGVGDGDDRTFPELVSIPPQKESLDTLKLPLRIRFRPIRTQRIAMAKLHTAVVTSESRANLRICGFGSGGRLGLGIAQHTQYALTALKELNAEAQIVSVALGQDHSLVLTNSGSILSWGLARFSQLGYSLDGGITLQPVPRRIVGPLKKEFVMGIVACRSASACWTKNELFTWGTNSGQLGYDRSGSPIQVLPRRVTQATLPIIDVAISDAAMAVLLETRDVLCFFNGRSVKINFPTQSFPSEIQAYRPPMAQNNASIARVVSCENTFAALSLNGEVFTFTLNAPSSAPTINIGMAAGKSTGVSQVRPQRVWALRKQFSAVKDVALGPDGTILLCTESGHLYLRSRTNKTSKFSRVSLVQRAVAVAASSAGAFAALRAECNPTPIDINGNSVAEDLEAVQPYMAFEEECSSTDDISENSDGACLCPVSRVDDPQSPSDDADESENGPIKKDVKTIFCLLGLLCRDATHRKAGGEGIFKGQDSWRGADLLLSVDSGFEFPVHRIILAARSQVLSDAIMGYADANGQEKLRVERMTAKPPVSRPTLKLAGVHPISALLLVVYLYTDDIPSIWDRRVALSVSDKLSECVPKTDISSIRDDLQRLATLLRLDALADSLKALVKRTPIERLASDMRILFDRTQRDASLRGPSSRDYPLAPDTVLEFADAKSYCHSTILRARSPFFASFFDEPDWTVKRRDWNGALSVNLRHMRWRVMEFVMHFIYSGGGVEIFDVLDFAHTVDDVLDFLFEVVDVAGQLLLDRLILVCSSVVLQFINISNACSILADASHFNASQLVTSVQGYLARNVETMLESHMLDELPTHLVRQLSAFIREKQAEKLPATRSGRLFERALETWKDWLALQDIPQPVVPGRKTPSGQLQQSPKLSPVVSGSRRSRRPTADYATASYSPPSDVRLPSTPPFSPSREERATGPDDIFVMDDVREEIPPLTLPGAHADTGSSRTPPNPTPGTYNPWKARMAQLPASKLDLRAIMAEAEGQRATSTASTASTTPPRRSRIVGFDIPSPGPSAVLSHAQKTYPIQGPVQSKASTSSTWRISNSDLVSERDPSPAVSIHALTRKVTEKQENAIVSGLGRDLKELAIEGGRTSQGSQSIGKQSGLAVLGKGKGPLGPTFAPTRQPIPSAVAAPVTMTRQTSEGSVKAWAAAGFPPPEPEQSSTSSSNVPNSFLAIQRQQRDQNASPARIKKSLLEIQKEEQDRAAEERALQEEIEFLRWWAAEEERIRRETQAQPGPPVAGPVGGRKGPKRPKGARKDGSSVKRPGEANAKDPGILNTADKSGDKTLQAVPDRGKTSRSRKVKPKATVSNRDK